MLEEFGNLRVVKSVDPLLQVTPHDGGGDALRMPASVHLATRQRVARLLLEAGRATSTSLAEQLQLTPTAIRRHLDALEAEGLVHEVPARQSGPRGPGRPARTYALTDAGRHEFDQSYDELATEAMAFIEELGGDEAVLDFSRRRLARLEERYRLAVAAVGIDGAADALVELLNEEGYAASIEPSPLGGQQICQHHCPVAHVAERYPQLCEAETEAISRLLGTHVQRLATIAHGDGVCTTHIPRAPEPDGSPSQSSTPSMSSRGAR